MCGPDHLDLVRSLGADPVIDYTSEDFTAIGRTFDLVLDAVGKTSFRACRRLLAPDGFFISTELGWMAQNAFLAVATRLGRGRSVRFPIPTSTGKDIACLRERLVSGAFRPVLDRSYRLDDIVDAYHYVETEQKLGNVVVLVTDEQEADSTTG